MNPAIRHCIDRGGTVVTATRRLARELRQAHDQAQVLDGRQAWESADILPWDAWIQRGHLLRAETSADPIVLTDSQCQLVWRDIVQRDVARHHGLEEPLWNIEATASAAMACLRRMREWGITFDDLPPSRHPDHAGFRRWLRAFQERCDQRGWMDRYRLPDGLISLEDGPDATPLVWVGFDQFTAQQQRLVASMQESGAPVEVVAAAGQSTDNVRCHVYPDADTQWRAAAAWAIDRINHDPSARIAIVVPDLSVCRDDIESVLTAALAPDHVLNPSESRELPFHVSLGNRLDAHPLARGLMDALTALTATSLTLESAEKLLLSPVIGGYGEESQPRAAAALILRQRLPWSLDLDLLLTALEGLGCPLMQSRLARATDVVRASPTRAPLSTLSSVITSLIDSLGWPGTDMTLDSDQYQAREAIREQVLQLGVLELVEDECSLSRAIALLGRGLALKTFQPEAPQTPLEVLDIREAAGLHFDHVWFADLTGERWPPAPNPDPFIPVNVQRQAGCPDADTGLTHALAATRQARLTASSGSLVQSRPSHDGDTELMPSPLAGAATNDADRPDPLPSLAARIHARRTPLERVTDDSGPPHPGGDIAGGTGLIQRQSLCPRSAFLRDRLGAGDHPFNRPGLDPAERGSLVHRVLDQVWRDLGDSQTLAATSDDGLDALINRSIATATARSRRVSGCGDAFFTTQQQWLLATLRQWFALERARSEPFEVVAREEKVTLSLEGLRLQFMIDRMDRFDDGSLALIDYKTGASQSVSDWFAERPSEPQLPLYVLSQSGLAHPVSVVAFARVRLGDCVLDGLSDPARRPDGLGSGAGLKVRPPDQRQKIRQHFGHWDDHEPRWRHTLGGLAREFLAGDARINPAAGGVCPDCPTPAFCRSAGSLRDDIRHDEAGGGDDD